MIQLNISPELSVVIPVYNEQETVGEILRKIQAVDLDKEIIIVDDYSTDKTRAFLKEILEANSKSNPAFIRLSQADDQLRTDNIKVYFHEKNLGKGAALRRGFQEAKGKMIIVQDADLEYDPQDYYKLVELIKNNRADVVYGSRFTGGTHRVLFFWHSVGNKFLTLVSNMFTNLNLTDVWTCYKVFRREVLQEIVLKENRFGFEPEITAKVAKGKWRVYEVPISYYGRTYEQGKKISWKDGVRGLWCVLRYNLFG
jgi:glycosyltransferase involved in cell wall biosynthesis